MAAEEESTEYVMGGSSEELDRIHGMHESTVRHTGKLLLAPVDFSSKLRILDSGTAAGRWLQDLRKEKGSGHEYVGTDMTVSFFPAAAREGGGGGGSGGIQYRAQDVRQAWPQDWQGSFDVVHQRFVLGGVSRPQLKEAVARLIGLVRPGGWIQLAESDVSEDVARGDDKDGAAPVSRLIRELFLAMGVEPDVHKYLRGWFDEAGLVDVQDERITVPVGAAQTDDPDMGRKSAQTLVVTARHLARGAKQLGTTSFSPEELDTLPARVEAALAERGGSYRIYAIWGRKPGTP